MCVGLWGERRREGRGKKSRKMECWSKLREREWGRKQIERRERVRNGVKEMDTI